MDKKEQTNLKASLTYFSESVLARAGGNDQKAKTYEQRANDLAHGMGYDAAKEGTNPFQRIPSLKDQYDKGQQERLAEQQKATAKPISINTARNPTNETER